MINFFRKIRKQLANENKFQRYFRYAFGEVALIMIGIFMALQLNNWNENRKQEMQFKDTIEQLYNTIKYDEEAFSSHSRFFTSRIENIDHILKYPDSIPFNDTPYILFRVARNYYTFKSESKYHAQNLKPNPNEVKQKELSKEILKYISNINDIEYSYGTTLRDELFNNDIAFPKTNSGSAHFDRSDPQYYSDVALNYCHDLLRSEHGKSIIKTIRSFYNINEIDAYNKYLDAISIRELIKDYYPEVKVFYKDVGIIGTAIDGFEDVKSTPMTLTNVDKNIWEITLYLKEGVVKFRCRDSWAQNWGVRGDMKFPKGPAIQDGRDIPIPKAGDYRVILNLTDNTYEFIKLADD